MIAVHHVLRSDAFFLGTDSDGHSVFVGATDEEYVFLLQAEVAYINVGRYVNACQVADVYRAVGIRKCRGYGCSFEVFFPYICRFIVFFSLTCKGSEMFLFFR